MTGGLPTAVALTQSLAAAQAATDSVCALLDDFTERLAALTKSLAPIQTFSSKVKVATVNMKSTLLSVEDMLSNLSAAADLDDVIRDGPHGARDERYLKAVDRIFLAADYLRKEGANFRSGEKALSALKGLEDKAVGHINEEIEKLTGENVSNYRDVASLPRPLPRTLELLSQDTITTLKELTKRLRMFKRNEYLVDYRRTRAGVLDERIHALLDQDGDALAHGSYVKGSHYFIFATEAYLRMLEFERRLTSTLIERDEVEQTMAEVIGPSQATYLAEGESIARSKKSPERVFALLDILETLNARIADLKAAAGGGGGGAGGDDHGKVGLGARLGNTLAAAFESGEAPKGTAQQFEHLVWVFSDSTQKAVGAFLDDIRHNPVKGVPHDGTVHALTSNTLATLRSLLQYRSTVEGLLEDVSDHAGPQKKVLVTAVNIFAMKVIQALEENLARKADSYSKEPLKFIFLLNNHHHILRAVRYSELQAVLGDQFISKYEGLIANDRRNYQKATWDKALSFLLESEQRPERKAEVLTRGAKSDGSLTKAQRHGIKDRFIGFNSVFHENYFAQKNYVVPNQELRAEIRQEALSLVLAEYTRFFNLFSSVNFTKNQSKYCKYSPQTVESFINKFFDSTQGL